MFVPVFLFCMVLLPILSDSNGGEGVLGHVTFVKQAFLQGTGAWKQNTLIGILIHLV